IADRFPGAVQGDAKELGAVVRSGLFDAPYLIGNPVARGEAVTVVDGGCDAVHPETGERIDEATRISMLDRAVEGPCRRRRLHCPQPLAAQDMASHRLSSNTERRC